MQLSSDGAIVIRRAGPAERDTLLQIWLRSVRATHTFLSEDDVQRLLPLVRNYLASNTTEFWVACSSTDVVIGFMGMSGSKMESLFLDPAHHRRGVGRRMVAHARELHGDLTVDVNADNATARAFYEACGFRVVGRSELDDQGQPHPLLHMHSLVREQGTP